MRLLSSRFFRRSCSYSHVSIFLADKRRPASRGFNHVSKHSVMWQEMHHMISGQWKSLVLSSALPTIYACWLSTENKTKQNRTKNKSSKPVQAAQLLSCHRWLNAASPFVQNRSPRWSCKPRPFVGFRRHATDRFCVCMCVCVCVCVCPRARARVCACLLAYLLGFYFPFISEGEDGGII